MSIPQERIQHIPSADNEHAPRENEGREFEQKQEETNETPDDRVTERIEPARPRTQREAHPQEVAPNRPIPEVRADEMRRQIENTLSKNLGDVYGSIPSSAAQEQFKAEGENLAQKIEFLSHDPQIHESPKETLTSLRRDIESWLLPLKNSGVIDENFLRQEAENIYEEAVRSFLPDLDA